MGKHGNRSVGVADSSAFTFQCFDRLHQTGKGFNKLTDNVRDDVLARKGIMAIDRAAERVCA